MKFTAEEIAAKSAKNRKTKAETWSRPKMDIYVGKDNIPKTPAMLDAMTRKIANLKADFYNAVDNKPTRLEKARCPTEHQEQCAVIAWCDTHPLACMIFAIPNGSHKSPATAAKFQREGLRKGYPDLGLDVARNGFHGLRIEMKRVKGSVTSDEQLDWIDFLHSQGYAAFVCKGADEAIKVIQSYLKE